MGPGKCSEWPGKVNAGSVGGLGVIRLSRRSVTGECMGAAGVAVDGEGVGVWVQVMVVGMDGGCKRWVCRWWWWWWTGVLLVMKVYVGNGCMSHCVGSGVLWVWMCGWWRCVWVSAE